LAFDSSIFQGQESKDFSVAPRRKRLKRPARLEAAKKWILTYAGSNIVHGFRRWFGVDLPCAIAELKLLHVDLDPKYVEQALASYSEYCKQGIGRTKLSLF
jgi:hypothetical protein